MKRILIFLLALILVGCSTKQANNSGGSTGSSDPVNLSGTWQVSSLTLGGVSIPVSGTKTITESGPGVGADGTTVLSDVSKGYTETLTITQSGGLLSGTITIPAKFSTVGFSGTWNNGQINITAPVNCLAGGTITLTLNATVTGNQIQGTYNVTGSTFNCDAALAMMGSGTYTLSMVQ
jgi:hypothetical protein